MHVHVRARVSYLPVLLVQVVDVSCWTSEICAVIRIVSWVGIMPPSCHQHPATSVAVLVAVRVEGGDTCVVQLILVAVKKRSEETVIVIHTTR